MKVFRKEGLCFPSRIRNQAPTIFQPLTISTAIRTLNNPRYAGAYVYGRRQYRRAVDGKKKLRTRERDDWLACIPSAHPGYIAWEQFQQNLNTLKANGRDTRSQEPHRRGRGPPCCRDGPYVAVVVGICAFDTPLDVAGWKLGTSATAPMARAASRAASRSRARR